MWCTALVDYNPRVTKAIDQLLSVVQRHQLSGQPMDVTTWFGYFVFDVMSDLAFNKSSNMLVDGKEAYVFQTIRLDMFNIALFTHLPWLLPFLKRTPILNHNYLKFWNWIQAQIDERSRVCDLDFRLFLTPEICLTHFLQNVPKTHDIFSYILDAYNCGPKTQQDKWNLHGDAQLIVIAGSDSVAAVLTHVFFHLAYDPFLADALHADFDALSELSNENLMQVALLDAVINETMRLHPPVASGTQRVSPPEGLWIGDVHIPGDVIIQVVRLQPLYTFQPVLTCTRKPSYTVFRGESVPPTP